MDLWLVLFCPFLFNHLGVIVPVKSQRLSLSNCLQEIKYYSQPERHGPSRRTMHLRAMIGGVTAAYTAFLVVVIPVPSEYEFVVFLTPALVLTWTRVYWERRIKKQP